MRALRPKSCSRQQNLTGAFPTRNSTKPFFTSSAPPIDWSSFRRCTLQESLPGKGKGMQSLVDLNARPAGLGQAVTSQLLCIQILVAFIARPAGMGKVNHAMAVAAGGRHPDVDGAGVPGRRGQ